MTAAKPSRVGNLDTTPVSKLRGVGPKTAERLKKLGIERALDLLFHLPARYEDRTQVTPMAELRSGMRALVRGSVRSVSVRSAMRQSLLVTIQDDSATMRIRLFHFNQGQRERLENAPTVSCYGQAKAGPDGLEMAHPDYTIVAAIAPTPTENALTPVYPVVEGLGHKQARRLVGQALEMMDECGDVTDLIPEEIAQANALARLPDALRTIHKPPPHMRTETLLHPEHPSRKRLAFEELLAHHIAMKRLRARLDKRRAPTMPKGNNLARALIGKLPFELTQAQLRVAREIRCDLGKNRPMHRLVQGDVGSGKTAVAALSACVAIGNGWQCAFMAPTELLAEQHAHNLKAWLEPLGVKVAWLAGKQGARERADAIAGISQGEAQLAIGTHALFQQNVSFAQLGLVIVDEQHRFGVEQRRTLAEKAGHGADNPHQLVMTATPIPRTLTMTAYADLDCSIIDELPPGRTRVETAIVSNHRRDQVIDRVRKATSAGAQAYWVCTAIEESITVECEAAEATHTMLSAELQTARVGLVHGRMHSSEKEQTMARFKNADLDVLVATTVIEVGVDVPNASLMIIDNAERLGLAQLHQLRGRVGRGSKKSACVMLYSEPLGWNAKARLKVLQRTNDGFEIARSDLEIRGPGEVLGTRQAGIAQMRIADVVRDANLIPIIEKVGVELLANHKDRIEPLVRRWIGDAQRYGYA